MSPFESLATPLALFHDGQCPLCRKEIAWLRRHPRSQLIRFIDIREDEPGSIVKGRFSPNPSVWTGFMLTYIALGTIVFFMVMFAVSQWIMKNPPSALMLIPIPVVIAVIMYWSSLVGQKIAHEQMRELYDASMGVLTRAESTPD